jgi:Holliday junction resolvase RusA-like endonuclease
MPPKKQKAKSKPSLNKVSTTSLLITCPFAIETGVRKKTRYPLNLNHYRNAHHAVNGAAKIKFKELMTPQLEGVGLQTPVTVVVQVFKPTRRILDKHNVDSIVKKFLYDAMTELGVWEDDNDDFVYDELTLPTIHDKLDPRVEVTFTSC